MNTRHVSRWFWPTLTAVCLTIPFFTNKAASQSQGSTANANVKTAGGLTVITFTVNHGTITVNLPDDMRAGDTISGTVIAEPKGQTPEERAKNMSPMGDQKIRIATAKKPDGTSDVNVEVPVTAAPSPFTFKLPPSSTPTPPLTNVSSSGSGGLGITLTNTSGSLSIGGTTTVPIEIISLSLQSVAPIQVQLPTLAQPGKPVEITSGNRNFDGNSANTNCTVAGQPVVILAESPNKVVIASPENVIGPVEISVKEGDKETKGTYRNVGVNLTAPKTSLLKGESTELHCQVTGLEGIKEPVPLTLAFTGVITAEGGPYQHLVIQPSQVGADGRYSTTRGITGIQAGGWNATATVVTHRFDVCLQDDTAPARRILWNTFNGEYVFINPFPPPKPSGQPPQTGSTTPTSLTGKGKIEIKGCVFTLEHNVTDRRVMSRIDQGTNTGSASVQTFSPQVKFTITDRSTTNNTCSMQ